MNVPGLSHIVDCFVFPTDGPRPHSDEISGSDLDGDMYFATWDVGLVNITPVTPMDFKNNPVALPVTNNPMNAMIDMYVSMMYSSSLGHIGILR